MGTGVDAMNENKKSLEWMWTDLDFDYDASAVELPSSDRQSQNYKEGM
jgi:hypothetical protein